MILKKKVIVNMSDNEDLLADDLGDHSLADYNLGNDEEDQLLADDFEGGASQNVSHLSSYSEAEPQVQAPPPVREQFPPGRKQYHLQPDKPERLVPTLTVEIPNQPERSTYAPFEPPQAFVPDHAVPTSMPSAPLDPPQLVPGQMPPQTGNIDPPPGPRSRFISERPVGAQRTPQLRDIPDTLDQVMVPGGPGRGRSWRNPHYMPRHHYRRNNMHMGNFHHRPSFPPPHKMRHNAPQIRPDIRPNPPQIRVDVRPDLPPIRPDLPNIEVRPELPVITPEIRPNIPDITIRPDIPRPDLPIRPEMPLRPDLPGRPEFRPERPELLGPERIPEGLMMPNLPEQFRPMERPPYPFRPQFRPHMDEPRPFNPNMRPGFDFQYQRPFRPFAPREVVPNMNHIPQVTIRHAVPNMGLQKQEVRMLPVQLPPNLPPGGLQGKKVLINPHFKGNFQPPVEGLTMPAYIPTRIQKTPPLSPTLENKFGPVKNIDDAAERFIAEQRNALARAASRTFPRRSPQRYIENTTIEIENELARPAPPRRNSDDDDLLRRQEEFINANRAGLRRRMRSPTPPRVSPRRSPERLRARIDNQPRQPTDEESEYRRRMREQEALRERVLRAKEVRRRRAVVERDRDRKEEESKPKKEEPKPTEPSSTQPDKPDTTRKSKSPEKVEKIEKVEKKEVPKVVERERSPVREEAEVNSTCEGLTPPRISPPRALTPPLPKQTDKRTDSDDDLDLILGDIDGILSDDDDSGRFKDNSKAEPPKPKPAVDLRSKLPPKDSKPAQRQKIVFTEEKPEKKRKEKSPVRKTLVTSSTKTEEVESKKTTKAKEKVETTAKESRTRQRIIFDKKEAEKEKEDQQKPQFSNRRVILQRKITQNAEKSVFTRIEIKSDPTKPNPGIFSRAVRTAIGGEKTRIVIKKQDEPQIEYESASDEDEEKVLEEKIGNVAVVTNLPHGMTDTRLKTLAGDVQNLSLDKEERSAKITFKTTIAAENFKKKFNNKMVAASRLTVVLR